MAHRQFSLLCLLNGRTGLLVCASEIYFSLFVRRGGRAGNFLGAAPVCAGAVWGRSRPAAHGQGRCIVGCIVWCINYTPAAVCKSAEYSPWCIVCTKFPPNKIRVYRAAIGASCGDDLSPGKGVENEAVLRKNYQALSFSYQALSFSYQALVFQNVAVRQSFLDPKEIAHRELPC